MSRQTTKELRNLLFYQGYLRKHSKSCTYKEFFVRHLGDRSVRLIDENELINNKKGSAFN